MKTLKTAEMETNSFHTAFSWISGGKGLLSHFILSKNVVLAEDFERRKISKVEIRSDQEARSGGTDTISDCSLLIFHDLC